jgi:hypothetical protein
MKSITGYLYYDEERKRRLGRVSFRDLGTGKRIRKKSHGLIAEGSMREAAEHLPRYFGFVYPQKFPVAYVYNFHQSCLTLSRTLNFLGYGMEA